MHNVVEAITSVIAENTQTVANPAELHLMRWSILDTAKRWLFW